MRKENIRFEAGIIDQQSKQPPNQPSNQPPNQPSNQPSNQPPNQPPNQPAELLVLFLSEIEDQPNTRPHDDINKMADHILHASLKTTIKTLYANQIFTGLKGQIQWLPTHSLSPYDTIVIAGIGSNCNEVEAWKQASGLAAKHIMNRNYKTVHMLMPEHSLIPIHQLSHALAEGFLLGAYQAVTYQTQVPTTQGNDSIVVKLCSKTEITKAEVQAGIHTGTIYAEATNYARDLTNMPGNYMTPAELASEASLLADYHALDCRILGVDELQELGMGGLYAVGKGSIHTPRMVVIRYQGLPTWSDVTGLVGKGITFDTGGISIKPASGMEEMVGDMGGAAVLLGVVHALGLLKPKINVVVVLPIAENMPSDRAFKPGDIITTLSGRTVEVLNTDAEGRMVLADGVTYVKQQGAERIIDIATLTGSVLHSFGDITTGAVTNHDVFMQEFLTASRLAGEFVWQLPSFPDYWDMLKSDVADIKNITSPAKWAGAINGGLFVGIFAEKTPWIHLDTGGTAWLLKARGLEPKGGTGAMVRSLIRFLTTSVQ